jgi:ketosteroid isomerase-like protein
VNEQEVRELFFERLQHLSPQAEYELRHPDYAMEMPQSGERIRGRDNMRAFQEAYPNPPTIQPRRVVGSGDVWVVEARSDYGDGRIYHVAMIVEFRDGKI